MLYALVIYILCSGIRDRVLRSRWSFFINKAVGLAPRANLGPHPAVDPSTTSRALPAQ